jgi:hypothetical protein
VDEHGRCLAPPQRLLLAMITIGIEIHFATLYMADLGTRAEPLGEGAQGTCIVFCPPSAAHQSSFRVTRHA